MEETLKDEEIRNEEEAAKIDELEEEESENNERESLTFAQCCASLIVGFFAAVVAILGLAVIVVAALIKTDKLSHDYFPDCDSCDKIFYVLYGFGALLVIAGVLGIVAAKLRSRALAIPFTILMLLCALAFLAIMILVIIFDKNPNTLHLNDAWTTTVSDDPKAACKIEEHLQCSGYSSCCGSSDDSADLSFMTVASPSTRLMAPVRPAASATTTDNSLKIDERDQDFLILATNASCLASSDQCPSDCSSNSYTTSCENAIINYVHKYFWAIIGVVIGIVVFCALIGAMAGALSRGKRVSEQSGEEQPPDDSSEVELEQLREEQKKEQLPLNTNSDMEELRRYYTPPRQEPQQQKLLANKSDIDLERRYYTPPRHDPARRASPPRQDSGRQPPVNSDSDIEL